ncbi:alpha/beta-hydrolase [Trametes versicolor FP-101664 SS1]|uniref:alpha/beta-hydrolase n=1 Tax=Trametes versicolor (strain FP-101664) TaxID=717944 RepID=UPI0004621A41|nr:alpha/beta-hydrolase [Trametes versicolor FP-101664 SS1]EIW63602.1 alpha/beta-hydrolase [Trametes versicolor FP-101664 SS1]
MDQLESCDKAQIVYVPHSKGRATAVKRLALTAIAIAATALSFHPSLWDFWHETAPPSHNSEPLDFDWFALEPASTIQWSPCFSGQQCARLILPLDYEDLDGSTVTIALRMIPATDKENYRGTLLVNPGGPGGSGTEFVGRSGQDLSRIVGPSFDVLGFDPRGVGASLPSARCFETTLQWRLWGLQEDNRVLNVTDGSVDVYRARERLVAERCEQKIGGEGGIGRFAGAVSVARDMLEIVQQLGQEKLQFWGFSYGTILGQYFASMYPDKVGRIILDGVYDANIYRAKLVNTIGDMDAVIGSFYHFCHLAGPEKCALWAPSAAKVEERYLNAIRSIEEEPIAIPQAEPPLVMTTKHLRSQIRGASYRPLTAFPLVAETIHAVETRNQTALALLAPRIVRPTECACTPRTPGSDFADSDELFPAIECSDGDARPYDPTEFRALYAELARTSPLVGPSWAVYYLQCAEWRMRAKRGWSGPFAAPRTAHPLLVLSPRFDPVCPLADARAVQARFGGAGLLVQESYGHCSLAAPSLCTARRVRAYMVDGTVPEEGAVCEVDELPFGVPVGDVRALESEDVELLEALKRLTTALPVRGLYA